GVAAAGAELGPVVALLARADHAVAAAVAADADAAATRRPDLVAGHAGTGHGAAGAGDDAMVDRSAEGVRVRAGRGLQHVRAWREHRRVEDEATGRGRDVAGERRTARIDAERSAALCEAPGVRAGRR